ncbi:MAG: pantoate--beta-alanine ligase, partial [Thermoleophilia bacterium]|nr:pantoate--beta-alanine ligase [Thermoleophilia bacterium]
RSPRPRRSFDRVAAAVNVVDRLLPGSADALARRLADTAPLALAATAIEAVDFGSGGTVFRVETPAGPHALKVFRRSLGERTPEQRAVAPDLYRALLAGAAAGEAPGANAEDVVVATTSALTPAFEVDYLAVVDADSFDQAAELGPRSVLVIAARLGSTRLIDNIPLVVPAASEPLTSSSSSAYPAKDATT